MVGRRRRGLSEINALTLGSRSLKLVADSFIPIPDSLTLGVRHVKGERERLALGARYSNPSEPAEPSGSDPLKVTQNPLKEQSIL